MLSNFGVSSVSERLGLYHYLAAKTIHVLSVEVAISFKQRHVVRYLRSRKNKAEKEKDMNEPFYTTAKPDETTTSSTGGK